MQVRVFTTQVCPKCRTLKNFLYSKGVGFEVLSMEEAVGMAELFNAGVYTFNAPVLQIGDIFYLTETLFKGAMLKEAEILKALQGE